MDFLNKTGLERLWAHILLRLNRKVDKIEGKGLSTEDFTTEEKEKLATMQELPDVVGAGMQLVTDANGNIKWDEIPEGFSGSWNDLKNKPFGNALIHSVKAIYLRQAVIQDYTEVIDGTYYYKNLTTVNFDTFPSNVAYAVVFYALNGNEDTLNAQTGTDTNTINFKIAGYDQVSIIIEEDKSLTLVMKPKATTAHSHNIKMDFTEFVTTFTKIPLDYVPTTIPTVQSAEVGQVVSVKAVNENGKPTEWEAVDVDNGPELPETSDPYMQLVTNVDGNKVWEERTHYKHEAKITYLHEEQLSFTNYGGMGMAQTAALDGDVGDSFIVTWDGMEYKCTVDLLEGIYALGNFSVVVSSLPDTGEPFVWLYMPSDGIGIIYTLSEETSHIVSCSKLNSVIKKISSEYLPKSIGENGVGINAEIFNDYKGNVASGEYSHAEGYFTQASSNYQHVQGKCNIADTENKYAHIVGNGTTSDRKNIHTVDWNGTGWFSNGLKVGGIGQDDANAVSVATLTDVYSTKKLISLVDQINGYTYIACMRGGNFVTYCAAKSIEIVTMPNKTEYMVGECFDPTGMVIVATCFDGSQRVITDISYSTAYFTSNTRSIEIIYEEIGSTFTVTVPISMIAFDPEIMLVDFEYTANEDGTYTITDWKGTLNGEASTEIIVPNNGLIIV